MKWHYLNPCDFNNNQFGLKNIKAIKVAKWHCNYDARAFQLKNWITYADLIDFNPISGRETKESNWYIYAIKGDY